MQAYEAASLIAFTNANVKSRFCKTEREIWPVCKQMCSDLQLPHLSMPLIPSIELLLTLLNIPRGLDSATKAKLAHKQTDSRLTLMKKLTRKVNQSVDALNIEVASHKQKITCLGGIADYLASEKRRKNPRDLNHVFQSK